MLTDAQAERLALLKQWANEIVDACENTSADGYAYVYEDEPDGLSNEDYLNQMINKMLTVRTRMYEEGDLKSNIPNFSQMWRDMLPTTKHQG